MAVVFISVPHVPLERSSEMRRIGILTVVLGLVVAACGNSSGDTTTTSPPDPTTELILYSGRNENFVKPVVDAFTEATGISVEVRYGDGTADLASTILNEGETTPADLFWSQDAAWIGAIGDRGLLSALPENVLNLVDPAYRDADGEWVGVTARSRVFVYNPDLVSEDELPGSYAELTDSRWAGRVAIAPGNASFVSFVSAMELLEGSDATLTWLEGMAANDSPTYSGNGGILTAVAAGDVDAGLVNHYYLLQAQADQGDINAVNHFLDPGDIGALVMATGVGVLEPSTNKEAAIEFIRYLLSADAQAHFAENLYEYGLIEGAPTPAGQKALGDLQGPDINQSDLAGHLDTVVTLITRAGLN